tara:strand:+ start:582 stop:749 length:168 start_codon:yes stop_codon:yes gene_type:complete
VSLISLCPPLQWLAFASKQLSEKKRDKDKSDKNLVIVLLHCILLINVNYDLNQVI